MCICIYIYIYIHIYIYIYIYYTYISIYIYIYRRADGTFIYIHPKKLKFAAYGQFVLFLYLFLAGLGQKKILFQISLALSFSLFIYKIEKLKKI